MRIKDNPDKLILQKIVSFKKFLNWQIKGSQRGNVSIILAVLVLMFTVLSLSIFDIFQLYIAREHTKNASDAAALAAAQNLLFFDEEKIVEIAGEVCKMNGCDIGLIEFNYDEVTVGAFKKVNYKFIGKIFRNSSTVYSTSKVKVAYPWDLKFNNCKTYKFEY